MSTKNPATAVPAITAHLPTTLVTLRRRRNLSQDALAELSGISRGRIAQMERQHTNPRLLTLDQLAAALDVDILDLLEPPDARSHRKSPQESFVRVACNLARLRDINDISQERLAKAAGHFRTYVTNLEAMHELPTLSGLEKLADTLRVSVIDLLRPVPQAEYEKRRERLQNSRRLREA